MNAAALLMIFVFAGLIISAIWQGKLKKIITNEKQEDKGNEQRGNHKAIRSKSKSIACPVGVDDREIYSGIKVNLNARILNHKTGGEINDNDS